MTENAKKTRRYYDALWNERDLSVIDDWISPDYVGHYTQQPEPVLGQAGFKAMASDLHRALPDLRMEILDTVAEGDRVASRIRLTGTNRGGFGGYGATGTSIDTTFMAIERYAGGRCVEEWVISDDLEIARQLKVLPAAGSRTERAMKVLHRAAAPLIRRRGD